MKLEIKKGSENYVCSVVKIGKIFDIEGADFVKRTVVNGNNVVVSKDVKEDDMMLYFVSGTKLDATYCRKNNLYTDENENLDKSKKGFVSFNQKRVKAIKLRGIISDGMLMPLSSLSDMGLPVSVLSMKIGTEFTDIDGISICEKFVVNHTRSISAKKQKNGGKKVQRISKLVENQFYLHGGTSNLRKNMHLICPDDLVSIHYKKHGTSAVFGNVLVKKQLDWKDKLAKFFGVNVIDTHYDLVYSSRKVVKNEYLNNEKGRGYYGEDIWGVVAKELKEVVPKGFTLYGEIIGFTPGGTYIQKGYDYGCKDKEYKFYVYKISVVNVDGQVVYLTDKQVEEFCDKNGLLYKDTFMYYGKASDLFPKLKEGDLSVWREMFLKLLEENYTEKRCYMCSNKVPEEGIVLRVEKLYSYDAYKLKSFKFLLMESEEQEANVVNMEDNEC